MKFAVLIAAAIIGSTATVQAQTPQPAHALASLSEDKMISKIADVARAQGKPGLVAAVQDIFDVHLAEVQIPGGRTMSYREQITEGGSLGINVNGDSSFGIEWRSEKPAAQGCEGFPSFDHLGEALQAAGFLLFDKRTAGGMDVGAGPKGVTYIYLDGHAPQSAKREVMISVSFLRCSDYVFVGSPISFMPALIGR